MKFSDLLDKYLKEKADADKLRAQIGWPHEADPYLFQRETEARDALNAAFEKIGGQS